MTDVFAWSVSVVLLALLASFLAYLTGLKRLSTAERPLTRTYDRYGGVLGLSENPDYRENAAEDPPGNILDQIEITTTPLENGDGSPPE